jgi:hypothetical protein
LERERELGQHKIRKEKSQCKQAKKNGVEKFDMPGKQNG